MERKGEKRNIWKIVSVAFIVIFISIIAAGIINAGTSRNFTQPTGDMVESAKGIVAQDLLERGDSIDNYEVFVMNRMVGFFNHRHARNGMPPMKPGPCPEEIQCFENNIQVALKSDSRDCLYIIDADSGKIVMRASTEWFND